MNYDLFKDINDLSGSSALDAVMKFSAKYVIFIVVAALVVLWLLRLWHRLYFPVVATVVALVLTFILSLIAAAAYKESRPFTAHPSAHVLIHHAADQSFPSDHATAAFGIALAVGVFLSRAWGAVLFVLALLIGFARVYVGIHYPSDIGGGFLCALVGVGVVALIAWRVAPQRPRYGGSRYPASRYPSS